MEAGEGSSDPEGRTTSNLAQEETTEPPSKEVVRGPNSNEAQEEEKDDEDSEEEEDDDDEEDEEPRLKYATLTKSLGSLYRNGDSTSACLVAGDKMIVGTHNGNIHVLLLPSLQSLKVYRAHSASVTSISISPYPPPLPIARGDLPQRVASVRADEVERSPSKLSETRQTPRQAPVPKVPSNDIYIASSSLDGNVCVSSLIDPQDVQLRNFSRPIKAVALSPNYKSDRAYLSGGQAGSLILTTGQKTRSTNASTTGAAATASSWLGSMGLGSNTGTDKVLHGNEGIINSIKWSLSGRYVLWVTEEGIKIMHSHLHPERAESGLDWKRISHVGRPARSNWEDLAGVWKARAEWIDRSQLEPDALPEPVNHPTSENGAPVPKTESKVPVTTEEVIVGWGDTVWLIKVYPGQKGAENDLKEGPVGRTEITASVRFDDCIISGVAMYTSTLILVLAHMEKKPGKKSKKTSDDSKKGRPHRRNGLEPELRIVDISSREEIESDALQVSRFETLTSLDYHLTVLPPARALAQMAQKSYLETIGGGVTAVGSGLVSGVETVGQGMYEATLYGPRKLGMDRLFSGAESVKSGKIGPEASPSVKTGNYLTSWLPGFGSSTAISDEVATVATTQGSKIFVFSPYDCIVGVKRNLNDKLQWLLKSKQYREAWQLLDEHPEAAGTSLDTSSDSMPLTPSKASSLAPSGSGMSILPSNVRQQDSLAEFFADSMSLASSQRPDNGQFSKAKKEKRRIGGLWVAQLLDDKKWNEAGEIAAKTLDTAQQWDVVVWKFIRNKKFDEISLHIPTFQITPPLQPLVYKVVLEHYVASDRRRFRELLDLWPSDLFEISSITSAVEDQLDPRTTPKNTEEWQILQECLAKLCLDNGKYKEALRCYIRLQDADSALSLIKEHHLIDTIADDIPSFVLLRIPQPEVNRASQQELEDLSCDPISLLVEEVTHGVVRIDDVVSQLQSAKLGLFLYFFLRALWQGKGITPIKRNFPARGRAVAAANLAIDEGHILIEQYADIAVELFAKYDRALLMEFLHNSTAYTFERAVKICEQGHLIEELVYLLSKTGSMKKALFLIIDELHDVSKAIEFAKEQNDPGLWDDFLEYSMSKPRFISGLLAEVGTAIDPIELVKRIPSGLEIEGLKGGLQKMIREYDLQDSISTGAAKVFSSEVGGAMTLLRRGRRQGIKFEINVTPKQERATEGNEKPDPAERAEDKSPTNIQPGYCSGCNEALTLDERGTLIGFACGHVYHVQHLLHGPSSENVQELTMPKLRKTAGDKDQGQDHDADEDEGYPSGFIKSIASKVTNARLLKDKVEDIGGCRICHQQRIESQ